jgi:hypothetical protein
MHSETWKLTKTEKNTDFVPTFSKYSELIKNIREKIAEAKGWRGMHSATKEGPNVLFDQVDSQ